MFMVCAKGHVLLWLNEGDDKALGQVEPQDGRGLGPGFTEGIAACSTDCHMSEKETSAVFGPSPFFTLCVVYSVPSKHT